LESFVADHDFPKGVFHLRQLRPKSVSSPADFISGSSGYKTATLDRLISDFPDRTFVLIGDSGEHDPEVFGKIARKHPEAVAAIAIRRVEGAKNGDERFQKAFRELPEEKWQIIDPPFEELPTLVD
ncbi:MAG: phosphatase domain-containing protein, partial [Bradymonadaceae bacterium]